MITNVLSPEIYVLKETKYINLKSFNMITNKNGAKAMKEHISCDCKCKCIQIKNGIMKHVNGNVKFIVRAKNDYIWNLAHLFVRIVSI